MFQSFILLTHLIHSTQEDRKLSRHDWKIVDCDIKHPTNKVLIWTHIIPVVYMYFQSQWTAVWILIRCLRQKPADLDLQWFQRINSDSAGKALIELMPVSNWPRSIKKVVNSWNLIVNAWFDLESSMYLAITEFVWSEKTENCEKKVLICLVL